MNHKYKYTGPVVEFDRLICSKWTGETVAESKAKALSNLAYQFKSRNNRQPNARVTLDMKFLKELESVM
jgi:hypothetical protein